MTVIQDHKFQDDMDAESLYDTLENEIIPLFYDRSSGKSAAGMDHR